MKICIYASMNKTREVNVAEALRIGFLKHGDEVEVLPTDTYTQPKGDTQLAVAVGLKGASKRIIEDHRRNSRHTWLMDKSYFERKEYWRIGFDGFQSPYIHKNKRPHDRWNALGIELKPKRTKSRSIIYAGSSQKYCDWHDLGDASEFAKSWCHHILKTRGRNNLNECPLWYRPKPSWAALHPDDVKRIEHTNFSGPDETLAARLPNCHAIVTHGSNAAVEAMIAGIPVMLISEKGASAVFELAETSFDKFGDPFWPTDEQRTQHFANLAYFQYREEEMQSGLAWDILSEFTVKHLATGDLSDTQRTIELYKMMHEGPKVFRGRSMKAHAEALTEIVRKHNTGSLLDYGCGKGDQYLQMALHEMWGGVMPTLYDPGYAPYAQKPKGKFGGVICTDVAEHIPESGIDDFLQDLWGYAKQWVFICAATTPARKFLPDGRNCHLTVQNERWWMDRVASTLGLAKVDEYVVHRQLTGGGYEERPHYVFARPGADEPRLYLTFRGDE